MKDYIPKLFVALFLLTCHSLFAQTTITKWKDNKIGAVSLTYDDGYMNQFRYALPVMRRLGLPATFYIITGPIVGSKYQGKFIGRPVQEIISETATKPTDSTNFFERESAAKYLGYIGADRLYDSTAILFEDDKVSEAYHSTDFLYSQVRSGALAKGEEETMEVAGEKGLTWDSIKLYASQGYEFSSHTVTHAHMAALDTTNMFYELTKSKEDIRDHLGEQYTFDAEIPFGIEHPRAMQYALPAYTALRNLMTDPYMQEINRGYRTQPGSSNKEYVQWQRGATTKTPMPLMQSWIDTTIAHSNIWLVLVFHGIDGMGYEPLSHDLLDSYFQYIKKHDDKLWIATFGEVARYIRERMNTHITAKASRDEIKVHVTHTLDTQQYNVPLTLKTYIPAHWASVDVYDGIKLQTIQSPHDGVKHFIIYQINPGISDVTLTHNRTTAGIHSPK